MDPLRMALAIVAMSVFIGMTAFAQDASQLAQRKGCMACHALDQKKVGPSFKDIAAKYKGETNAAAKLEAKLKNGDGHVKANASDAELRQLVAYVLGIQ